jgi:tRNA wybutosine-synthesizing protein 4
VDIDYPDLITIKAGIIAQTPGLNGLLTDKQHHETPVDHVHYQSNEYIALGCDLRDLDTLQRLFEKHGLVDHAVFFTAEVSLTYMAKDSVDALIAWAASLPSGKFPIPTVETELTSHVQRGSQSSNKSCPTVLTTPSHAPCSSTSTH